MSDGGGGKTVMKVLSIGKFLSSRNITLVRPGLFPISTTNCELCTAASTIVGLPKMTARTGRLSRSGLEMPVSMTRFDRLSRVNSTAKAIDTGTVRRTEAANAPTDQRVRT